jgi:hypothetical protein
MLNSTKPSAALPEESVAAQFKVDELEPRHETAAAYSGSHDSTDLEHCDPK